MTADGRCGVNMALCNGGSPWKIGFVFTRVTFISPMTSVTRPRYPTSHCSAKWSERAERTLIQYKKNAVIQRLAYYSNENIELQELAVLPRNLDAAETGCTEIDVLLLPVGCPLPSSPLSTFTPGGIVRDVVPGYHHVLHGYAIPPGDPSRLEDVRYPKNSGVQRPCGSHYQPFSISNV